jgi:hypothetical protein
MLRAFKKRWLSFACLFLSFIISSQYICIRQLYRFSYNCSDNLAVSLLYKTEKLFLELKMDKSNNLKDDDGTVNDSSCLQLGSDNCQIDYKYASKGPQIKAAIAG